MQRSPALDGVRALAAITVVAFHTRLPGVTGGYVGVDVFFVLSGFLITSLLVAEYRATGGIDMPAFWWRRAARLYPALLLMLAVVGAVIAPVAGAQSWSEIAASALYVSDYTAIAWNIPDLTGHTWSLAVEMQFYLIWPLVVLFALRQPRIMTPLFIGLFLAMTVWRCVVYAKWGWVWAYYGLDTHGSGLLLGAALATIKWRPSPRTANLTAVIAILVLATAASGFVFYSFASAWGGALVDIAAFTLIMGLTSAGNRVAPILAWPPLARLGLWSYGLYLWHYPIARLTRVTFESPVAFTITLIASCILAAMSYELVETRVTPLLQSVWSRPLALPRPDGTSP